MVYSKFGILQIYILSAIALLITLSYVRELQIRHNIRDHSQVTLTIASPLVEGKCLAQSRYFFFIVPGCETLKSHKALQVTGTVMPETDNKTFSKKRLIVENIQPYELKADSINDWFLYAAWLSEKSRVWIASLLVEYVPQPGSGFMMVLLFGDDSWLDPIIEPYFITTGTLHILATSGMHLTIIIEYLESVFSKTLNFRLRGMLLIASILGFLVVVGGKPSLVRAGGMSLHYLISKYILFRNYRPWYSLVLVSLLGVIVRPEWLHSPGYQLSVVATFAVVVVHPNITRENTKRMPMHLLKISKNSHRKITNIGHYIRDQLQLGLLAQLLTSPIVLWHFGTLPLLGFISSALVLWIIPFLTKTGIQAVLLLALLQKLRAPQLLLDSAGIVLLWLPADFFLFMMQSLAKLNWLTITV